MRELARRSFDLHAQLAGELGHDYGYRRMETLALLASERRDLKSYDQGRPDWLDGDCALLEVLGDRGTTAQVHPARFTRAMMQRAGEGGAEIIAGAVEGLVLDATPDEVRSVRVNGELLDCDAVVLAMGPWTTLARQWLPLPPVYGMKGHSITLRPTEPVPAHALFAECETHDGDRVSPEIFPRPDGEVYVCGLSDQAPLPPRADEVESHAAADQALRAVAGMLSSRLGAAALETSQACYRPVVADGLPLLGAVPGVRGAYVATGHSVWGILNAPASGEAMAELILDGRTTHVDLAPFDPGRDIPS